MPVSKRMTSQRAPSTVVSTRVVKSFSSMTSFKTVSHSRTSSGKMLEAWSSPSLALTSPQTWVSGPQAKFLSPPMSASPKLRVTRRASIYVRQLGAGRSNAKSKSPPKGMEFKVPTTSVTSSTATRTKRSSVYHQSGQESAVSRRSSVYRKGSKGALSSFAFNEAEESKLVSHKGRKTNMSSPKGKKLPSPGKKAKSHVSTTRSRKRNVSELEREESPEKPAAKRSRRQAGNTSLSVSPKKAGKSLVKSSVKRSKASAAGSPASTRRAGVKRGKKAVRSATNKRAAKSPSPQKTPKARSMRSKSKSPSPVRQGKTTRTWKGAVAVDDDDDDDEVDDSESGNDLTLGGSASTSKALKSRTGKRKAKEDTSEDTPKRKSPKLSPQKSKSKGSRSSSKSTSTKKSARKVSARKSRLTASPASKNLLLDLEEADKKTPSKSGGKADSSTKKRAVTPKSTSKSGRKSRGKSPASTKKLSSRRRGRIEELTEENAGKITSSKSESSTPSKTKPSTPKSKTKSTTPKSSTKRSASGTRSQRGKQSADVKTPGKRVSPSFDSEKQPVTPKSGLKSRRKSQKMSTSSAKKSASASRSVRKSAKKTTTQKVGSSDSLDGSYVQVSVRQLKMTSPSKKVTSSSLKSAQSLEDERILEILRNAVKSTSKPVKMFTLKSTKKSARATPKRLQSAQKSAKSAASKRRTAKATATPTRSAKVSLKSTSSVTKGTSARKTSRIVTGAASTPKSIGKNLTTARKSLLTPQNRLGAASFSRTPSAFLSRDLQAASGGEFQLGRSGLGLQSLGRRSEVLSPRSRASLQGQNYREEKSFSQYVERHASSGSERYGSRAVARTVGDQTYCATGFVIERGKGSLMEREQGEGVWVEDNVSNNALSMSEDANTTIDTSTYSSRCTIL